MRFEGIITPVGTPHRDDHSIDHGKFADVLEFLIGCRIDAALIAGTTGEYYAQSTDERIDLMARAKEIIPGRRPLIVGTGAMRAEGSIAHAEAARDVGADAIPITTLPYAYPTGREIALHVLAIDRAANLPVLLYNYTGRMSANMDEETLDRFGRSPNFMAIKESSGSPDRQHMLAHDYPHIALSRGMDGQALEFFVLGADILDLCRIELRARGAAGHVPRLRRREGFRQGPADHDGQPAADARAGAGRQVRPVHQVRHVGPGHRPRPAASAADGAGRRRDAGLRRGGRHDEPRRRGYRARPRHGRVVMDLPTRETVFGPGLSVNWSPSDRTAVAVASDTDHGLTASVLSASGRRALRAAPRYPERR